MESRPMMQYSSDTQAMGTKAHVLIVDDNGAMRNLLRGALEEEGLSVEVAASVADARRLLIEDGDRFDMVVSDINMPIETGFDLLRWIKEEYSPVAHLPVLLTTAELPEVEHRLHGLSLGAVDYVVRPVDMREFALRVVHAVENHQRIKSLESSLQDSQGLAMVGRLLAASNHEIKNLAMIVNVTADQVARIMDARLMDPSDRESGIVQALRDSSSLLVDVARHINDLLEPGSASQKAPIDIASLVKQVAAMMQQRVRPILIEFDGASEENTPWALGHVIRVKQVLVNLILNAADAIHELSPPAGGIVTLGWGMDDAHCYLTVTDNGIGLPQPGVRTEFTAFSTTKKLRGGQGLGLWLCSRLMENIGGCLALESAGIGRGVTARMTLEKAKLRAPEGAFDDLEKYFMTADEF